LSQASRLAGMNRFQFQHLLASRGIPRRPSQARYLLPRPTHPR
jgi:predicted HTH domain antitoxin